MFLQVEKLGKWLSWDMDPGVWELSAQALHSPGEGALQSGGLRFPSTIQGFLLALNQQLCSESLVPAFSMTLSCCGCAASSEAQRQPSTIRCFLDNSPWAVMSVGL